ncbi:hypothetical protein BTVI_55904 [Pitangus sulphuratus]|nr:hypothetical protein BTVI_55904 [Pitangus sulphuratus]
MVVLLQPVEEPTPEHVDLSSWKLQMMERPCKNTLLARAVVCGEETIWRRFSDGESGIWTYARAVHEELHHMGRTYNGAVCEGLSSGKESMLEQGESVRRKK